MACQPPPEAKLTLRTLPHRLLRYATTFLCWVDTRALRTASKQLAATVQDHDLESLFKAAFRRIGSDDYATALWDECVRNDLKISGSIVLQVLYATPYPNSDIDVYKQVDYNRPPTFIAADPDLLNGWNEDKNIADHEFPEILQKATYTQAEGVGNYDDLPVAARRYRFEPGGKLRQRGRRLSRSIRIKDTPAGTLSLIEDETIDARSPAKAWIDNKDPTALTLNYMASKRPERRVIRDLFDLSILKNVYSPTTRKLEIYAYDDLMNRRTAVDWKMTCYCSINRKPTEESPPTEFPETLTETQRWPLTFDKRAHMQVIQARLKRIRKYRSHGIEFSPTDIARANDYVKELKEAAEKDERLTNCVEPQQLFD